VVITNAFTRSNSFGHSAIAFTGEGVYSFGNSTPIASSLTEYLAREAPRRYTILTILNTTPDQEQRMVEFLQTLVNVSLQTYPDNCASRTSDALDAGGLPVINTGFPDDLRVQAEVWQLIIGGNTVYIPQTPGEDTIYPLRVVIPGFLNEFNPTIERIIIRPESEQ
jgi:hypothetical protein